VISILPEADSKLDRLDRLLAVERDRLAVRLELLATPRPKKRIPEDDRVAEGVTERLPHRAALSLKLLARRAVLVPVFRKLCLAVTKLGPPRFPICEQPATDAPRHANPFLAVMRHVLRDLVIAALRATDRLGHVADIDDAVGV